MPLELFDGKPTRRGQTVPYDVNGAPSGGSVSWGHVLGTLSAQTDLQSALNLKANTSALAAVAFSGAYADLTGRPVLATVATSGLYSDLTGRPSLATVATTGAYSDLTGRPSLGTVASLNVDIDGSMAANSDSVVPSQKAVRTYVATAVTGTLKFKAGQDCSANPNYPAASKGDVYVVTVAGKIGGASGVSVEVGDEFFATADNAGGTQAAVGSSWEVLEHNFGTAPLIAANNLSDLPSPASARTALGLATVASSGSASDLGAGTLPAGRLPAFSGGDVTSTIGTVALVIGANKVTRSMLAAATGATVLGATAAGNITDLTAAQARTVLGLAAVASSGSASDLTTGTLPVAQTPAYSGGDVTKTAGSGTLTIAAGAVSLAKMANLAASSFIGNNTGVAATPIAMTVTQAKALLAIAASDVSGLAPVATSGSASDISTGTLAVARGGTGDTGTAWTAWTPAVSAGSGTITTVGTVTARYKALGKTLFVDLVINITTNGTGASFVSVTLPPGFTAQGSAVLAGREDALFGKMLQALSVSGSLRIMNYDNSYPGADGARLIVSGCLEVA